MTDHSDIVESGLPIAKNATIGDNLSPISESAKITVATLMIPLLLPAATNHDDSGEKLVVPASRQNTFKSSDQQTRFAHNKFVRPIYKRARSCLLFALFTLMFAILTAALVTVIVFWMNPNNANIRDWPMIMAAMFLCIAIFMYMAVALIFYERLSL